MTRRVLIVDDEVELVSTLTERLELRNIAAEGAASGEDALRRVRETAFDAVLLDVKMPGIGGLETLQQIRRIRPAQRVVLLTGHSSSEDAAAGVRLGAEAYLMKPVRFQLLLDLFCQSEDDVRFLQTRKEP